MSGIEDVTYSTKGIAFPDFYIHPDYSVYDKDKPVEKRDIEWFVGCDFKINAQDGEQTGLSLFITVTLNRKTDGIKIAELKTKSTYTVFNRISFSNKYLLLCTLIDRTIGHAQGGWQIKNRNILVQGLIPQAFGKFEDRELALKKRVYEEWI
jgi:hypothetical protein